uniref:G-protein coupled receptors family 1 profile domain-containing protein n=1 Tax=Neogobius melanostomus TaxID=47308 RepID=A0A8C6SL63_9GOBI
MLCSFNGTLLSAVLPPFLLTQFVLGALGNGLALWIFCFHLKPWKSSTVLLFNLAMTDFLLILVLPFRASYFLSQLQWNFGSSFCNICLFMLAMNRRGSTLFLMAIALDRYMHVVHPHHPVNFVSPSKAMCGASVLWLLAVSMSAQVFTLNHTNSTYCQSLSLPDTELPGRLTWHKLAFAFSFYIPLLVILYCTVSITLHLRRRRFAQEAKTKHALRLLIVVVVVFVICFLPSNITQIVMWYRITKADLTTVFNFTISLTYLNSVLDPVVYYFSNPAFKDIFRRALHLPQASDTAESPERKTRHSGSHSNTSKGNSKRCSQSAGSKQKVK